MDFFTTNSAFFAPLLIIIGFFLLTRGSDWLVDGASAVAKKFGISPLVIGLTVVSFGTSMPELVVSVSSTLSGNSSIAVANVVGSNIFNILAILGICATIRPIRLQSSTVWKEIPFTMAGIVTLIFLAYGALINTYGLGFFGGVLNGSINEVTGSLGLAAGVILLIFFVVFY
jgi:cation:H+ antiporter